MSEVITVGCTSDHDGEVISGQSKMIYKGSEVACVGDDHDCPEHGVTPIVSTPQSKLKIEGKLVAVDGAEAACGAVIEGCKDGSLKVS